MLVEFAVGGAELGGARGCQFRLGEVLATNRRLVIRLSYGGYVLASAGFNELIF